MDKNSRKLWEKRPDETPKAYDAFVSYIKMPIRDPENPHNERTLANLSVKLNYKVAEGKSASTLEGWSSKYNWQERAKAYDAHRGQLEISVVDASLAAYQEKLVQERTAQTTLMNTVINNELLRLLQEQKAGLPIKSTDIARLTNSMKTLDDLERRIAGLPTTYTSEKVDDTETNETRTFTIGG